MGVNWETDLKSILKTADGSPCSICPDPVGVTLGRVNLEEHLENVEYFIVNFTPTGKASKFFPWMKGQNASSTELFNQGTVSEMVHTLHEFRTMGYAEGNITATGAKFFPTQTSKMSDINIGVLHIELKNKIFASADNDGVLSESDIDQVLGSEGAFRAISGIGNYQWKAFKTRPGADEIDNLKKLWRKALIARASTMVKNVEDGGLGMDKVRTLFGINIQSANQLRTAVTDLNHSIYSFIK